MKLIDRYILVTLARPLVFCLVAFYCLFIVIDLFDTLPDIMRNRIGLANVVHFYTIPAPLIFQQVIPAAFFLAVVTLLVNWSDSREIISIQSAGTGLARVSIPFFFVALGIMSIQYLLFYRLSPQAGAVREELKNRMENKKTVTDQFKRVVYKNPTTGALWYAQAIDLGTQTLTQAEILMPDDLGRDRTKIFAAQGSYKNGYWDFAGVRKVEFNRDGSAQAPQDLTQLDARFLNESPEQLVAVMREANSMTWPELAQFLKTTHVGAGTKIAPYQTENYYRIAYPFLCPVLCLFAFSLGIQMDRRNKAAAVFRCLLILGSLILSLEFFKALGNGKKLSPLAAAWSPILLFGLAGLYLFAERVGWMWNLRHFIRQGENPPPVAAGPSDSDMTPG